MITNYPSRHFDPQHSDMQHSWCSPCGTEQLFEQPPCVDGHDADCLDLACVVCGHAITVGVHPVDEAPLLVARAA